MLLLFNMYYCTASVYYYYYTDAIAIKSQLLSKETNF